MIRVGDFITGWDRSFERTIYVVEKLSDDGLVAWCWIRYYDGEFLFRNDKPNIGHLYPCPLSEYRELGRNDYSDVIMAKAQFMIDDDVEIPTLSVRNEEHSFTVLDVDDVFANYEGIIVRSYR